MHIDEQDSHLLQSIQRLGGASVQQLCDELQVTATAVRQRLNRMQGQGYVQRESVPQDRGRPVHCYRLTSKGLRSLGDESGDLAVLLWREMSSIEDGVLRTRVAARVREALVARLRQQLPAVEVNERIDQLCAALEQRGLVVERRTGDSEGDLPIIREYSCPYHDLATVDPMICELEKSVYEELLGAPVELSACRLDGHTCCDFQIGVPS